MPKKQEQWVCEGCGRVFITEQECEEHEETCERIDRTGYISKLRKEVALLKKKVAQLEKQVLERLATPIPYSPPVPGPWVPTPLPKPPYTYETPVITAYGCPDMGDGTAYKTGSNISKT